MKDAFVAHVIDLLSGLGRIEAKRMFGGHGVYCDGTFIAIVLKDSLYFKADAASRAGFRRAGLEQFEYSRKGRRIALNFYGAPAEALESPAVARKWGRAALSAARRPAKK